MIKIIKGICGVLTAMMLLVSCMKSNNNSSTLYSDTAITSFSLGTLKKTVHTTSSTGADSTYTVSVTGSDYKFSIDHLSRRIFNVDSLPQGTDVSKVVCNVSALNNGGVFVEDLKEEGALQFVSDSIDLSVPRTFRVYASDGSGYESYRVEVNVHKQNSEEFVWTRHTASSDLATLEEMKAVMLDSKLFVYGLRDDKTVGYATNDGETWEELPELADKNAYRNMVVCNDIIYTLNNGSLISSTDGKTWEKIADAPSIVCLTAASYSDVYGLADNGTLSELNLEEKVWANDLFEDGADMSMLPAQDIAFVCYPAAMTYYADYVVMAGTSDGVSDIASVWRKIVEYDLQNGDDKWIYMDRNDGNQFALPQLKNLVMIYYDNSLLAWGINGNEYSPVYQSRDNGLVWRKDSKYKLPDPFTGEDATFFGAATDGSEIWIVGGGAGEVWSGHLNRLAWENEE